MGLFTSSVDKCPKCRGKMEPDTNLAMQVQQKAVDRGDLQAAFAGMMLGGPSYFRCTRCGYQEERKAYNGQFIRRPYNG